MINLIKQNGHFTYNVNKYLLTTSTDLTDLAKLYCGAGSEAYVFDSGKTYIYDGISTWCEKGTTNKAFEMVSSIADINTLLNNVDTATIVMNDTIKLDTPLTIPTGKAVVLDLMDSEISNNNDSALIIEGNVTLKNGNITNSKSGAPAVVVQNGGNLSIFGSNITSDKYNGISVTGNGSNLTINSGTITAQKYGIGTYNECNVVINDGHITGLDNFGLGGNGSAGKGGANVVINGGTIEGKIQTPGYIATAIYWPNTGTLTINGGTIISDGAGIVMRGGTVNLYNCNINAKGQSGILGKAEDSRVVVGPYAIVYDKNSKYPAMETLALYIDKDTVLYGTDGDIQIIMPDDETSDMANINDNR